MFEIGFLDIRVWDILDIVIVGYLLFLMYKLVRGTIAFNIFIGLLILYITWWMVGVLKMELLSGLLSQFVSIGVIALIIIFQPEVRRFLLILGNTTLLSRSNVLSRFLGTANVNKEDRSRLVNEIRLAVNSMSESRTGALIVIGSLVDIKSIGISGVPIHGDISKALLEAIFVKNSPLHDGAVLIAEGRIIRASSVLPVSNNDRLPSGIGLRHRAAVGITESTNVVALIVSEENGKISYAKQGKLRLHLDDKTLNRFLEAHVQK